MSNNLIFDKMIFDETNRLDLVPMAWVDRYAEPNKRNLFTYQIRYFKPMLSVQIQILENTNTSYINVTRMLDQGSKSLARII